MSFLTTHKTLRSMLLLAGMGATAGFLGGLLGIGGGALIVPGLVLLLNFDQHRAHGTSLVSALLLATAGVTTYSLAALPNGERVIDWRIYWPVVLEISAGGVIGATIGARVAEAIHANHLRRVFSLFIVIVGVYMIWQAWCGCGDGKPSIHPAFMDDGLAGGATIVGLGLLTGFLSALLGIGGGMVMIPALVILLCANQQLAQAISLAAMIPTAFTGVLMHRALGNVDFKVGFCVGAGAIMGVIVGGLLAFSLRSGTLQTIFGIFLFVMAGLMALKKNGRGSE